MKTILKTLLVAIAMPAVSFAGHHGDCMGMGNKNMPTKGKMMYQQCPEDKSECPMHDQMGQMGAGMGNMMGMMQHMHENMGSMMKGMHDPEQMKQMQEMHDQMGTMMQNMQEMHKNMGMMKGMMMDKK